VMREVIGIESTFCKVDGMVQLFVAGSESGCYL
jgi:hypothetical protein